MAAGRDSGFSQARHQDKRDGGASCSGAPVSRMHENRPDRALNRKICTRAPNSPPGRSRHALARCRTVPGRLRHAPDQGRSSSGMSSFGTTRHRTTAGIRPHSAGPPLACACSELWSAEPPERAAGTRRSRSSGGLPGTGRIRQRTARLGLLGQMLAQKGTEHGSESDADSVHRGGVLQGEAAARGVSRSVEALYRLEALIEAPAVAVDEQTS